MMTKVLLLTEVQRKAWN